MRFLLMLLILAGSRFWTAEVAKAPFFAAEARAQAEAALVAEAQARAALEAAKAAEAKAAQLKVVKTRAPDLAAPVALKSGGKVIDVDVGHAAPFLADLGDGKLSLLIGQFGGGKLRAYPLDKSDGGHTP